MPVKKDLAASVIGNRWTELATKIAVLAAELPANRLEWQPQPELRSYGTILRHMAFWNRFVSAKLRGESADDQANELPVAEYNTKEKTIEAFTSSSSGVVAALTEAGSDNVLEAVLPFLEHNAEHYGQLSVYARLLQIVPPASRP